MLPVIKSPNNTLDVLRIEKLPYNIELTEEKKKEREEIHFIIFEGLINQSINEGIG